jgi:hypothetical protein
VAARASEVTSESALRVEYNIFLICMSRTRLVGSEPFINHEWGWQCMQVCRAE